jgi:hypothetical protein
MSHKEAKKIRKVFKKNTENVANLFFRQVIKPKPKFIPNSLWFWLMSFFIRINIEQKKGD